MKAANLAMLAAVLLAATVSGATAEDLSHCVTEAVGSFKMVELKNTCSVPVRVYYKFKADVANPAKINQWMELNPGQDSPVADQSEVAQGGGLLRVVCPSGEKAYESDGAAQWAGRSGGFVCKKG